LIRDTRVGGDWTGLDFARRMERIEEIRPMIARCLAASLTPERFTRAF